MSGESEKTTVIIHLTSKIFVSFHRKEIQKITYEGRMCILNLLVNEVFSPRLASHPSNNSSFCF